VIITKLIGGLGNQMFQYAAGRSLAIKHNERLKLDTRDFRNYGLHNGYELNLFQIEADVATCDDVAQFDTNALIMRRVLRRLKVAHKGVRYERTFKFDEQLLHTCPPVYLDGYWQSYKYFEGVSKQIRKELTPKTPLAGKNKEIAQRISSSNSVSIHVRRGDYISNPEANKTHGFVGIKYYEKAIQYVRAQVTEPHFFVFSDDLLWARENLGLGANETVFVDHNMAGASFEDMRLMSLCNANVIANSSFSWWGAWLGYEPGKLVLYPANWFAIGDKDISTLCPSQWMCV
jgi:hypothetical protein